MHYDPNEDYNDTSNEESNDTDQATTQEDKTTNTHPDKNAPDELSQPGVGVQYERDVVGDSD